MFAVGLGASTCPAVCRYWLFCTPALLPGIGRTDVDGGLSLPPHAGFFCFPVPGFLRCPVPGFLRCPVPGFLRCPVPCLVLAGSLWQLTQDTTDALTALPPHLFGGHCPGLFGRICGANVDRCLAFSGCPVPCLLGFPFVSCAFLGCLCLCCPVPCLLGFPFVSCPFLGCLCLCCPVPFLLGFPFVSCPFLGCLCLCCPVPCLLGCLGLCGLCLRCPVPCLLGCPRLRCPYPMFPGLCCG
jgi:hypothetical protein